VAVSQGFMPNVSESYHTLSMEAVIPLKKNDPCFFTFPSIQFPLLFGDGSAAEIITAALYFTPHSIGKKLNIIV